MVRSVEIQGQLFELAARDHTVKVKGLVAARGNDEGQVDFRLAHRREVALGLFRGVLQALQRHGVAAQVDLVLLAEALDQPVDEALVVVLAAKEGVARSGHDLEHAVGDIENRHVEGAAAEIENHHLAVDLLAEPVG